MPRRPLRCIVELNVHAVTAPGVWLPSREDIYVSISIFNQFRKTPLVASVFPLLFHERFRFEKTFYTAIDPAHVTDFLTNERVTIELIQLSDFSDGAIRLATYSGNARDFLYPYPTIGPMYTDRSREILMSRTVAFPGISPKIEFTAKTVIKESMSADVDALEDALEDCQIRSRSRSRRRSRSRQRSSSRGRSASPRRLQYDELSLSDDYLSDVKQPFVVKRLDDSLISRVPGSPASKALYTKRNPRYRTGLDYSLNDDYLYPSSKPKYRLRKVIGDDLSARYWSSDSDDMDYMPVTPRRSRSRSLSPRRARARSVSPVVFRTSLRDRFPDSTYSSSMINDRVTSVLRRERSLERLPSSIYTPRFRSYDSDSLDDLAVDFALAKNRSLVHLDDGHYWTQKAAQYSGRSHREIFNTNLSRIYSKMYKNATQSHR